MVIKSAVFVQQGDRLIVYPLFVSIYKSFAYIGNQDDYRLPYTLLDTTFRQFFYNESDHVFCGKDTN